MIRSVLSNISPLHPQLIHKCNLCFIHNTSLFTRKVAEHEPWPKRRMSHVPWPKAENLAANELDLAEATVKLFQNVLHVRPA